VAVEAFDRSVLKVGQVFIIGVDLLAFVLGYVLQVSQAWLLVPLVGVVMLVGVANPELNVFRQLYLRALRPRSLVKPRVVQEDATPHRFANGMGGSFLIFATIAFLLSLTLLGWILTWMVIALAALNFAFDICVGCQIYFQLDRLNLLPNRG
jgi:hypothetical protein